jgi:hypothetical protein
VTCGARRRRGRLHGWVAWLSLAACTAAGAAPRVDGDCSRRLLEEFGWRFAATHENAVRIEPGTPCDRATLAASQSAGDLQVFVPEHLDASDRARLHAQLLAHPATTCAFGFRLGDATRRAVDKLVANDGFRFSALQVGWIGFGPTGARRDGWTPVASFGRGYQPADGNWRAIEGFYTGAVRGECGLGRQVAQYATQAELYGREAFDAEFGADEIVIGTFNRLRDTRSILLGSSAGEFVRDGVAEAASRDGRQAFMGLPGFIYHVFDRSKLDDLNNQAENFVVYDVSAPAAAALRVHRGFEYYNDRNREIWSLARTMEARRVRRFFERLLYERDPELRAALSPADREVLARLDAELADPFYRGFALYVHRQGVKPVGFHIARLLDRNPRTPFRIELALHNVHTTLYQRYVQHRLRACSDAKLQASRTVGSDAHADP